ncbi:MAG: sigma factor-like helix-turn-helix DNA-binding protein [Dehalococcoidales bacterium]
MNNDQQNYIIRTLAELPHAFQAEDITVHFYEDDIEEILVKIENSNLFIWHTTDFPSVFISKDTLFKRFIRINFRLASLRLHSLSSEQLLFEINNLRLQSQWTTIPTEFIEFGNAYGLINLRTYSNDNYTFPLAYILSFIDKNRLESVQIDILNRYYLKNYSPFTEDIIFNTLKDMIDGLTCTQRAVISYREGLFGEKKLTLEEIGLLYNRTRERIRQIQVKAWKKISLVPNKKLLLSLLLIYILNKKCSLILDSKIKNEIMFLFKLLDIPINKFPKTNIKMIGKFTSNDSSLEAWKHIFCQNNCLEDIIFREDCPLIEGDRQTIIKESVTNIIKKLNLWQKIFLTLKQLGEPSHFSKISNKLLDLFPDACYSEKNIHATLGREGKGIVWVGIKGTYALEEWGYERPKETLMKTIANIVKKQYSITNKPVKFIVIEAEIGKYRKLITKESLTMATFFNPEVEHVGNWEFTPKTNTIEEDHGDNFTRNEIDKILQEFENENVNKNK